MKVFRLTDNRKKGQLKNVFSFCSAMEREWGRGEGKREGEKVSEMS